jgi:hypothetical protein
VEYCEEIRNMLSLLASQNIQFEQFIKMKYELDREYQLYDEEVDEILEKLQANNKFIQVLPTLLRISASLRAKYYSSPWTSSTTQS